MAVVTFFVSVAALAFFAEEGPAVAAGVDANMAEIIFGVFGAA